MRRLVGCSEAFHIYGMCTEGYVPPLTTVWAPKILCIFTFSGSMVSTIGLICISSSSQDSYSLGINLMRSSYKVFTSF